MQSPRGTASANIYAAHEHRFDLRPSSSAASSSTCFMVQRIDEFATIAQQVVYLTVVMVGLDADVFRRRSPARPGRVRMFVLKRWYFTYRTAILHFFLGTLLNMYTIFFFKSSSLITSCRVLGRAGRAAGRGTNPTASKAGAGVQIHAAERVSVVVRVVRGAHHRGLRGSVGVPVVDGGGAVCRWWRSVGGCNPAVRTRSSAPRPRFYHRWRRCWSGSPRCTA